MTADYAPPRSWEQFEELCADVFQSAWSDPGLVRHGRSGQTQDGVDIVARHGAIYPIGLQCKKRGVWPVGRLTAAEIDEAVAEARNFEPPLKQFYILTTAPSDAGLLTHVREISQRHERDGLFTVGLFGWEEVVRRAKLDSAVMAKHFGPSTGAGARSPLLATWFMAEGRLEMTDDDLALAVAELSQDLRDWPTGHFEIRQRESDALLSRLREFEGRMLSKPERETRINLRRKLRTLTNTEERAVRAVRVMLVDPDVSSWLQSIYEPYDRSPIAIEAFVNEHANPKMLPGMPTYLRMTPPDNPENRCETRLSEKEVSSINAIMRKRIKRFGAPLTDTVMELPDDIRYRKAIPRIVRELFEFMERERVGWDELHKNRMLEFGLWTASVV